MQRSSLSHRFLLGKCLLASVLTLLLEAGYLAAVETSSLDVTSFGARGDAAQILVSTVSNSSTLTVTSANQLSSADVGKRILLFEAGPATTATNNQDLVAQIVGVSNGTNVVISPASSRTATQILCTYGTDNASAFQKCIDACTGTNAVVRIPSGNYLLLSPQTYDSKFVMGNEFETHPAVTIQKGGIHFLGASPTSTVLLGCGAWQIKGPYAYRGYIFALCGPVTNDAPLIFENLTMDGGVQKGNQSYSYFPARLTDGSGWDATHDAVLDIGLPPLHARKEFRNCQFLHWRGEQVKSVVSGWDGFILITNCVFGDGNASGINFSFSHNITGCLFSNLVETMEFYQGYCSNTCYFQNNTVTNMSGALMAINGALAGRNTPSYVISNNLFYLTGSQNGIQTTPAQNVLITSNFFTGSGYAFPITLGVAGYQGSTLNSNITISFNTFSNQVADIVQIEGAGENAVVNVQVVSNQFLSKSSSYFGYGYGWSSNVTFIGNVATNITAGVVGDALMGQWFLDDPSNSFPPRNDVCSPGVTNTITYMFGRHHRLSSAAAGGIFVLDDSKPERIPPKALLMIEHTQQYPVTIYTSTTAARSSLVLSPGQTVGFQWTNGLWRRTMLPPFNVRLKQ